MSRQEEGGWRTSTTDLAPDALASPTILPGHWGVSNSVSELARFFQLGDSPHGR